MRRVYLIVVAGLLCVAGAAVYGQTKGSGSTRNFLVQAQCLNGLVPVPCDPTIVFKNGFFRIKRIKQPNLVGPSTAVGKIRMQGVNPPQPNGLQAHLTGLVSYGSDPDSDCPLANTQVLADPLFTAQMTCVTQSPGIASNCKGLLQLPFGGNTTPPCSDVTFTIENLQAEVYEDGSVGNPAALIARNGIRVIGRSPDCDSGGTRCP